MWEDVHLSIDLLTEGSGSAGSLN